MTIRRSFTDTPHGRTLILCVVFDLWIVVRFIIYGIAADNMSPDMMQFAWWWSWFMATPITGLVIMVPSCIIGFIRGTL